jgi:hypothetical protein
MVIQFRAWTDEEEMVYQGEPDLETLESFIFHWGNKELMLWTGLYDSKGVRIYDKDILRKDGELFNVFYNSDYGMFCVDTSREFDFSEYASFDEIFTLDTGTIKDGEVVGNMYETDR